jgi:hypothetical protein
MYESHSEYRRSFRDIVKGFTKKDLDGNILYIKHLTTHDQVDLEDIEKAFYEKAKKRGLETEKEKLLFLEKEGSWNKEDELFIEKQIDFIKNLNKTKSQLVLKSQIDAQQKLIIKENNILNKKINEKNTLLGSTCESYAKQRVNDYYITKSFFKDDSLLKPLHSEEEYDNLSYSEIGKLVKIHNSQFNNFSEENIQKLILQDFYFPYMPFCEDTVQFFGKAVCELTHNQLKLILFTRIFKNVFDNNEDIPDHIRKDPEALLDFASSSKKGKEALDKYSDQAGASTIVGATKEDYDYMGVKAEKGVSLRDAAAKKGGTLNMNDLMNISGA